jgi:hypothetical protein
LALAVLAIKMGLFLRMTVFAGSSYTGCGAAARAGGGAGACGIGLGFATWVTATGLTARGRSGLDAGAAAGIGGACVIFIAKPPARAAPTSRKPMCRSFIINIYSLRAKPIDGKMFL